MISNHSSSYLPLPDHVFSQKIDKHRDVSVTDSDQTLAEDTIQVRNLKCVRLNSSRTNCSPNKYEGDTDPTCKATISPITESDIRLY